MRTNSIFSGLALLATSVSAGNNNNNRLRARQATESLPTITQTVVLETVSPGASVDGSSSWSAGWSPRPPIHPSCNATEQRLLSRGIDDAMALASHARDHILRFGNSSDLYIKYFGDGPQAEPLGWFEKIVSADKTGAWLRCDDIDGNCHQEGWGGHWRGENATSETVICPLSYTTRMPLEGLCGYGYTVAAGELNLYFGSDLIHRLLHVPAVGEGVAEHYADTYADCLALAVEDPAMAARNSHTLQYFALDAYAWDVALPMEGCTGTAPEEEEEEETTTAAPEPTATPTTTTGGSEPSSTTTSENGCHTHADGEVHC